MVEDNGYLVIPEIKFEGQAREHEVTLAFRPQLIASGASKQNGEIPPRAAAGLYRQTGGLFVHPFYCDSRPFDRHLVFVDDSAPQIDLRRGGKQQ
jgi:hypothetical protein